MTAKLFNEILERHVRTTLIPQMTKPLNRFLIGAALGSGTLRAESMKDQLSLLGVMGPDGDIDTRKLSDALLAGFDQAPEVSVFGLVFSKDDALAFLKELNVAPPAAPAPAAPAPANA